MWEGHGPLEEVKSGSASVTDGDSAVPALATAPIGVWTRSLPLESICCCAAADGPGPVEPSSINRRSAERAEAVPGAPFPCNEVAEAVVAAAAHDSSLGSVRAGVSACG